MSFAVAAVQLGGAAGRDAVAKLGAAGEVPEPGLPPIAVLPSLPALGPLHEAVRDRALVSFTYRGRRREVEPYGLAFRLTAWYLVGRDRTAPDAGLRTFRVDRIEDAPTLGDSANFELPKGFDLREAVRFLPWRVGQHASGSPGADSEGEEPAGQEMTMVVDARLARSVVATVGAGSVEAWEPSGAVRLRIVATEEKAFVDWVVGLGDTAEILAPAGSGRPWSTDSPSLPHARSSGRKPRWSRLASLWVPQRGRGLSRGRLRPLRSTHRQRPSMSP